MKTYIVHHTTFDQSIFVRATHWIENGTYTAFKQGKDLTVLALPTSAVKIIGTVEDEKVPEGRDWIVGTSN